MDDVDVQMPVEQPFRGFEAQQAAANDHDAAGLLRVGKDAIAVHERAEDEHARLETAGVGGESVDRRYERPTARRDDERIVRLDDAVRVAHLSGRQIDGFDLRAGVERDAVRLVPRQRV